MEEYPYNSLILVYAINTKKRYCVGTAFQINEQFAITSAHNLWDKGAEKPFENIRLFPKVSGTLNITKVCAEELQVTSYRFSDEYIRKIN
jgi:hypothetical protein